MITVVIPTLNEEAMIEAVLERARLALPSAEIIVSDGQSSDGTQAIAERWARVVSGPPGRGQQMNRGAFEARGDILLFLHADTLLPPYPVEDEIERAMADPRVLGGNFGVKFKPSSPGACCLELAYGVLRRVDVFYGDSAIFTRTKPFLERDGFHPRHLMEDVDLNRWMRRTGRLVRLPYRVVTSSRRFHGRVLPSLAHWAILQTLYAAGVSDSTLHRWYRPR